MSRFDVNWSDAASDQLADAWIRYPAEAQAITRAQADIDRILAQDPLGKGQPVAEGLRKLTVPPLTAYYSVDQTARTVQVDALDYTP
jgi:hypothetical protein